VFANSTLLTVPATPQNMTHLFFQDASLNLRRYDLTGYAQDTRLDAVSTSSSGTPGTRLAVWPDSNYCEDGECVTLLYQRFNTSDLHYSSFSDNCGEAESDCSATKTSSDSIVPLVQTYGINVEHFTLSKGAIAGIVIGFCCFLLLCGLALRKFSSKWKPMFKSWTRSTRA
jgi:hypothetical protein